MRVCGACGQLVPLRWRNAGRVVLVLEHVAGAVIESRLPPAPRDWPWGRIVDRVQSCTRCTAQLVRGTWALHFPAGELVIEYGAGGLAPVLLSAADAQPATRAAAHPCG